MEQLYAKSRSRSGEQVSLLQHSSDVERTVRLLFPEGSRWKSAWLRFFQIAPEREAEYWKALKIAALLHDIGKANKDFQAAVTVPMFSRQSVRHEHLSALLLCARNFRDWLARGGVNPDMVIAAVLSHHLKATPASDHPYAWCQSRGHSKVALYLEHPDIASLLRLASDVLQVNDVPTAPSTVWSDESPWREIHTEACRRGQAFRRSLRNDLNDRRLLTALKAGLVVADAVASATVREAKPTADWLRHNAHREPVTAEEIENAILAPRASDVTKRTGKVFDLHSFQRLAGKEGSRTLLLAPCGAGKTIAAWEWAKHLASERQFGRVIFLYPTRGTATEGFRDYVGWAPEGTAMLLHGSSEYELAAMATNPPDSLAKKDPSQLESEARMFALGLWRYRFFSATVDQFLSFLQNRYQALVLLPMLADSVVIIDEVHSYDTTMFELLRSFLREFDIPVLCMTATLSVRRKDALEKNGLVPFPRAEHASQLSDLEQSAQHPRYSIGWESAPDNAIARAIEAFVSGKRVLIVVNRVMRCLEVARLVEGALGTLPMVYHSRFRLMDRQERHRSVVDTFKKTEAAIAVTTQVCEMSLDLDAQMLVTEVAPVPSLVQRLGRANRHLSNPSELAEVVVYPPAKHAPYEREELELATRFVSELSGVISQRQLTDALETGAFTPKEPQLNESGLFLSGGYFAVPGSFRDEDQHSSQCICDSDQQTVEQLYKDMQPIDGYLLPAPRNMMLDSRSTALPPYVGIVSSDRYSPMIGLEG